VFVRPAAWSLAPPPDASKGKVEFALPEPTEISGKVIEAPAGVSAL
jgi:hypothetical protein